MEYRVTYEVVIGGPSYNQVYEFTAESDDEAKRMADEFFQQKRTEAKGSRTYTNYYPKELLKILTRF